MSTKRLQIIGNLGGTVEVDETLTQEGMAADAKAVGDALAGAGNIDIDLEGSIEGEATPINADTLGGIPASEYITRDNAATGSSGSVNVTLVNTCWDDENEQTVNVEGVTATNTIIVGGDLGSEPHYTDCEVYCSGQSDGTLTFKCTLPPSKDLVANVAIL